MSYEGRTGFRGGSFRQCPVEMGKEYDVEITETSRRGEGIARIQGFVIFVPETKPGDKLKIKITRISGRCANAEAVKEGTPQPPEE